MDAMASVGQRTIRVRQYSSGRLSYFRIGRQFEKSRCVAHQQDRSGSHTIAGDRGRLLEVGTGPANQRNSNDCDSAGSMSNRFPAIYALSLSQCL